MERLWDQKANKLKSVYRADNDWRNAGGIRKRNRIVFRKATDQHQVVVDRELKEYDKDYAPLTICVTGPTRREWGFVTTKSLFPGDLCRTWVPWREYLGLPPDEPGRG
jgi:hypothetical protein